MQIKDLFNEKVITISNLLTMMRILSVPFIGYYLYIEHSTGNIDYRYYQLVGFLVIIFSDFFDGQLARLLNQVSKLGQFLDPVADKIAFIGIGVLLCIYKDFPVWLFVIAGIREIGVFIAALLFYLKKDIEVKPNIFGKLYAVSLAFAALVYTYSPKFSLSIIDLKSFSVFLILLFYILGILLYVKTYFMVNAYNDYNEKPLSKN